MRARAVALVMGLTLLPSVTVGQVPAGPVFRVNTYTTGNQTFSRAASDVAGNFVVTWVSAGQDGSGDGVFARRFDASGAPLGAEFHVNTYTTGSQSAPSAAVARNGPVFFSWHGPGDPSCTLIPKELCNGLDIYGRGFDGSGIPTGDEVRLNPYTPNDQMAPSVAAGESNFVVVWNGYNEQDYSGQDAWDLFGRTSVGETEFVVNESMGGDQFNPLTAVAMSPNGGFVVVWQSGSYKILARRFDAVGTPAGPELVVIQGFGASFADTFGPPAVALDADGNFVVVWSNAVDYGQYWGNILGRKYDASGVAQGPPFVVNSNPDYYDDVFEGRPSVAMDGRGGFVVAWQERVPEYGWDVVARAFDSSGPTGEQFAVAAMAGMQLAPSVTRTRLDDFVVTWHNEDWDHSYDVFGRRYRRDLIFRDGFESGNLFSWSSAANGGGDLGVQASAALDSSAMGLRGLVNDTTALYVQDESPDDEPRYRARFWIDPNGFDPGVAESHLRTRVFIAFTEEPSRRVAAIVLRLQSGSYTLLGRARLDDNSQADTGFISISDAPHAVEIDLKPASGPEALDGFLEVYVDGVLQRRRTGLDNSLAAVDFVRMGALSAKSGANGTIYWDSFESRRQAYIGP